MAWTWKSATVVVCLLFVTVLAGCLGGDSDDLEGEGSGGEPLEGTGSVTGRVLTMDLDVIAGARVLLVDEGELVVESRSDEDGRYQLRNVEPGAYRLQVTATCCREAVQGVEVVEGESVQVDVQLVRFTSSDLQTPYVQEFEWSGFLACGFVVVVAADDACSDFDDQSERTTFFEIDPGLKTITAGLVWDSPGLTNDELQFGVANTCGSCTTPTDYYGFGYGSSPVLLRIDEGEGDGDQSWAGIEETTQVQWRVFPPFWNVDLYFQQEFTVYYQLHYHEAAPEGFDPLPDR